DSLRADGLDAHGDVLDVTDPQSVDAVVARWDDALGLATVVNNAGIAFAAPVAETDPERWDRLMAINLRGPYLVIRAVAPRMTARRHGAIVNVASTSSFTASSQPMAAYDVSKAGVRMLTQSAARELGPHGVRVNAVAPGTMDTALVRALFPDAPAEELIGSRIPLGRLGDPAEIAEAVAFLADPAAAYVR
ncbi:SDR family NAD(P)-dependent oxidoreductase, partial [Mesorhizobium japonicum]|uniref:SDR family NAD(P)-dependent oxidoreductase n=1 Tax=Mesorhizobium japonicum TaxID=2066070 RepID=UPI003B5A9121